MSAPVTLAPPVGGSGEVLSIPHPSNENANTPTRDLSAQTLTANSAASSVYSSGDNSETPGNDQNQTYGEGGSSGAVTVAGESPSESVKNKDGKEVEGDDWSYASHLKVCQFPLHRL
jgi:hypothetical protein